jgi:hypothetical protein
MLKIHKMKINLKLQKFMQKYLNTRQLKIFGKLNSMARRYRLLKFNQRRLSTLCKWNALARKYLKFRSLQLSSKWFKMADRLLCINDEDHMKKRVDSRWLKLMIRFQAKHPSGW